MRLPVPRNRLVVLTLLAATLTLAVTVSLAYPALLPETASTPSAEPPVLGDVAPQPGSVDRVTATYEEPSTPATVAGQTAVTTDQPPAEEPVATAEPTPPTPNPNFTPAVGTVAGSGSGSNEEREDDEHEWYEHDDDDEREEDEHEGEEDEHEREDD